MIMKSGTFFILAILFLLQIISPKVIVTTSVKTYIVKSEETIKAEKAQKEASSLSTKSFPNDSYEMLCRVNKLRRENGKSELRLDQRLNEAAQKHAAEMARNKKMSHVGFTSDTKEFNARIKLSGYIPTYSGENVAFNQKNIAQAMNSWTISEGHRANLLGDHYECLGYGMVDLYWAQELASGTDCSQKFKVDCSNMV